MNEKPPKRRLKLNVTEPPRRMLQEVVIKPNNELDDYDRWFRYWYSNREDQLAKNARAFENPHSIGEFFGAIFNGEKTARKQARNYISDLQNLKNNRKEYVISYDKNPIHNITSIQNADDETKEALRRSVASDVGKPDLPLDKAIAYFPLMQKGLTQPGRKTIYYRENIEPSTIIHERTHLHGPVASKKAIYHRTAFNKGFTNKALNEGIERDYYLDSREEIYSRLNALRYDLQLDPKKVWTIDEIRALTKDKRYNKKNLDLDRYTDEFLLHLFNEVADNNTSKQQNKRHLDLIGDYA